jgi:hypothetical protein
MGRVIAPWKRKDKGVPRLAIKIINISMDLANCKGRILYFHERKGLKQSILMRVKAMKNWISMKLIWNKAAERRNTREYMTLNISSLLKRSNIQG